MVKLFVDVRHDNFHTTYLGADDTKNLSQSACAAAPPRREGLALSVATGLPSSTAAPHGREARSRAFLSWPGIEPLYSGVAINTPCAPLMTLLSSITATGAGPPSRSSLNGGTFSRPSQTSSVTSAGSS